MIRKYRRITWAAFAVLVLVEFGVFQAISRPAGMALMLCTAALAFAVVRSQQLSSVVRRHETAAELEKTHEAFYRDDETGLPNRQNLIETLGRDISRSVRRGEELTLVVVQISRLDDLRVAWGADVGPRVVSHVAATLLRITRNSDFLARIDDDRFACILVGCKIEQAALFADRANLAVTNRPLEANGTMRVPLYAEITVRALQFDPLKFRGPLEFLSAAGGDVAPEKKTISLAERQITNARAKAASAPLAPGDAQSLRKQLLGEQYHPDGKAIDFAHAYQSFRDRARRVG
jgi:diguanylate cyclase (GGDEF)-like protein